MRVRSVAVVIDGSDVLVIRRHKNGRDYSVLPGGGVEGAERPGEACLRELLEETGLRGEVREALAIPLDQPDSAFYFRVTVGSRTLTLGEPELSRSSAENRYEPAWVPLSSLHLINLVPDAASSAVAAAQSG